MLEQQLRQRVILGELLQHFFVGGRRAARRLLHDRQLQLLEEDLADLLRRAEIEFAAGQLVRLPFELDEPRRDLVALRGNSASSISTPVRSILRSTSDTGISISRYTRSRPASRAICG
jgi:hypothetical protein